MSLNSRSQMINISIRAVICGMVLSASTISVTTAQAQSLGFAPAAQPSSFEQFFRARGRAEEPSAPDTARHLKRQLVAYATQDQRGTIIVDTGNTYLYFILGDRQAIRYGTGVGRDGFTWSGVKTVERKAEWPDWVPLAEMIARQPFLPRFMAGGQRNPLGARALYLGGTVYRIHGTNQPSSIGSRVSSGCIRMLNEDVVDLYARVQVGTKVVVLPASRNASPASRRSTVGWRGGAS
jgi:lipoprotein-anchoring transpeptidase ErfK/SrfK